MADMSNEDRAAYIKALLRERRSCEVRGLEARLPLIDKELRRLGHEAAPPEHRAERRPSAPASRASRRDDDPAK